MELLQSRRNGRQKQNRTITTVIPRKVFKNATFSVKVFVLIWSNDNFVAATLFGAKIWIFTSKQNSVFSQNFMKLTKFFISCAFLWKPKRMMLLNDVWWNRDLQRPKSWNWKIRFISWSNGQVSEKFYWKVSFIFILGQESVANMNKTYQNSK